MISAVVLVALGAVDGGTPALLPREVLFSPEERVSPKVSPDGKRLAWLASDVKNVKQVWVRTLGTPGDVQLTQDRGRGFEAFSFSPDSQGVLVTQNVEGDGESSHVLIVDFMSKNVRDLTPWQGVRAELLEPNARFADTILVSMNQRDRKAMDVWRINVKTGAAELDTINPGDVVSWLADPTFVIRAAVAAMAEGGTEVRIRDANKAPWRPFITVGLDESLQVYDFSNDNKSLLLSTTISGDTARIVEKSLKSGTERVLAQNEKSDPVAVLLNPSKHLVQAVAFEVNGHREWKSLDYNITADLETALKKLGPGEPSVVSADTAEQKWVVAFVQDTGPTKYVLYDRTGKNRVVTPLFTSATRLENLPMAPMTPVSFTARDGQALTGFLTLPLDAESKKSPLVVLVHDGPWSRDRFGARADVQLLANRGYAVLQVNFRGSAGGGKRFMQLGQRQFGLAMNDDLADAARWAIEQGAIDPRRVAVVGQGYGGYAAVVALENNPELFACGVEAFGPLTMSTWLSAPVARGGLPKAALVKRLGNPADPADKDLLAKASPLSFADKLKVPLLVAHGANDPHVKTAEVEQLAAKGAAVSFVTYADEADDFSRFENRLDFYARVEGFLAQCLQGRAEPMPKEGRVSGSSAASKPAKK